MQDGTGQPYSSKVSNVLGIYFWASPALVLDPSDDSARYVLMPLRV